MLCEKNKCTGCFSCYNACPKKAITMKEDNCGYIYPSIDEGKCIKCRKCEKVCPAITNSDLKEPVKCYAIVAKDKELLKNSTSGGISIVLAKKIISDNGVVYGAAYIDKECNVGHIRVDNENELNRIQGSKYVHSYINDVFIMVRNDLNSNRKVLFTGTPCQVDGLKHFLR